MFWLPYLYEFVYLAIYFLLPATPSFKVLSCGIVRITIIIWETESHTIGKYGSCILFGTSGAFLSFLSSCFPFYFILLFISLHFLIIFVILCTYFPYPEWITADLYVSARVTHFHKMTFHSVKWFFALLVGGRNVSLRNTFSHFIHLINADLAPRHVMTLCPVTAYYELQSKLHFVAYEGNLL